MQATSTASSSATRVNLGPLTTTFNPPGDCTSLRFINDDVVIMGAAVGYGCYEAQWSTTLCTTHNARAPAKRDQGVTCYSTRTDTDGLYSGMIVTDWYSCPSSQSGTPWKSICAVQTSVSNRDFSLTQSCYPPKFASSFKPTNYDTGKWPSYPPIYSPGLACPSGYLPTCTVERIKGVTNSAATTTAANANKIIWSMLNDGEIAIGCCPSNYACDQNSPHLCVSTPHLGDIIAVTDGISCSSGTVASQSPTTLTAEAMRILLVKSDNPTTAPGSSSANDLSSKNSSGNGAKIAIGVVVPTVVLLIGAAALYFLKRKKRLQKQTTAQEVLSEKYSSDLGLKSELPGSVAAATSGPKGVAYQKPELDNTAITVLPELAADSSRDEMQELHGSSLTAKPTDATTMVSEPQSSIIHIVVRTNQQNLVSTSSSRDDWNILESGLWKWSNFDMLSGSTESSEHPATGGHQQEPL
ncbi:hypothetical protein GGI43DRAFT_431310 [Trichoderma evansii]